VTAYDEEKLGEILSALPPAPEAWVKAAQDLPLMRRGLDEIVERAASDEQYRRRVIEDPATALEEADVVAHGDAIEILRERLDEDE
jgi:alkylation response protein AidB-like acyl-CoA dehydrogenase